MVTLNETEGSGQETFPDALSDAITRELEFMVAISSEENSEPTGAPMLDALTTYREEQLN